MFFRVCLLLLAALALILPWGSMNIVACLLAVSCFALLLKLEKLEKQIMGSETEARKKAGGMHKAPGPRPRYDEPLAPGFPVGAAARETAGQEKKSLQEWEAPAVSMDTVSPVMETGEETSGSKEADFSQKERSYAETIPEPPKTFAPGTSQEPPRREPLPPAPERPRHVPPPSPYEVLMEKAWDWLKNGNPVVKVGLVVFLFGVSFLLRYAVQRDWFPPELRVALAGLFGLVLLGIGWRLRITKRTFALLMQGGGIATLYLTTFAAAKPDTFPIGLNMISPEYGLVIMTALVVFSAILAVLQDALWVALFGWAGGFMAPILLSTGMNRYIALFSYYALLNTGLLGVAWFKSWRYLNLLGFFFTFGVASLWGLTYYSPEFFPTTEPFLILFFLMYAVISILFAKSGANGKEEARLDSVLVFGLPLIAFGLQMGLVHDTEMGGAYSCLALSAWYLATAKFLWKKEKSMGILAESHIGLGIIFLSLAVPLAFDATATASTWALSGAGMVWLGLRQKRILSRAFGILLQIGAAVSFLIVLAEHYGSLIELGQLLAGLFLGLGGLVSSWAYGKYRENCRQEEKSMDSVCGVWGLLFWYLVWVDWLIHQSTSFSHCFILLVFALSQLAWLGLHKKTTWPIPRYALQGFLFLVAALALSWPGHPAARGGWFAWPFALGLQFATLYLHEKKWDAQFVGILHTGNLLLVAALFMWEVWWQTDFFVPTGIWAHTAPAVMGGLLLLLVSSRPKLLSWPLQVHERAYMRGGTAIGAFLALWWFFACFRAGGQEPLPYVPVLNVLDLGQALVIVLLALWTLKAEEIHLFHIEKLRKFFTAGLAASIFIWLNVVVTRIAHFWGGIPYDGAYLFRSAGLQATYSVLWTFMAFLAMSYSHRRMRRELWFVGAGLLALVVAKLFLVDLSGRGTIAGIVSFLGVGILMLVVGYLCPLPPRQEAEKNA